MKTKKGFIFTADALLGLISVILLCSLVAVSISGTNFSKNNLSWQQSQAMLSTQSEFLTQTTPANTAPNGSWTNYFCYYQSNFDPTTGTTNLTTHCEETK